MKHPLKDVSRKRAEFGQGEEVAVVLDNQKLKEPKKYRNRLKFLPLVFPPLSVSILPVKTRGPSHVVMRVNNI